MKRRVVVTGLGAVTPIGNTVEEFWDGIKEGKVGIGEITKFDTTEYKVKIAAEVKDFQAKDRMEGSKKNGAIFPVCGSGGERSIRGFRT